jgi:NADH:ubiquinone reductase (non-electrogenic)
VTLVDQHDRFVFKPLLYEVLNGTAGSQEVAPSFAQVLAPYDIRFVQVRHVAVRQWRSHDSGSPAHGGGLVC